MIRNMAETIKKKEEKRRKPGLHLKHHTGWVGVDRPQNARETIKGEKEREKEEWVLAPKV